MEFSNEGLGDFITDPSAEANGIEYRVNPDVSFFLRRAGGQNKAYDRSLSQHSRPYLRRLRANMMTNDEFTQLVVRPTFVDSVIVGWKGVKDAAGKEIPFSKQACKVFLDAFPNVFEELMAVATDMSSFRAQEQEDVADSLGES